ncbi:MAG: hypothetical protein R3C44_03525 [Chloroflexota bacterium]
MLHDSAVNWALDHYLGLREPELQYIPRSEVKMTSYLGTYQAMLIIVLNLYLEDGVLMFIRQHRAASRTKTLRYLPAAAQPQRRSLGMTGSRPLTNPSST